MVYFKYPLCAPFLTSKESCDGQCESFLYVLPFFPSLIFYFPTKLLESCVCVIIYIVVYFSPSFAVGLSILRCGKLVYGFLLVCRYLGIWFDIYKIYIRKVS